MGKPITRGGKPGRFSQTMGGSIATPWYGPGGSAEVQSDPLRAQLHALLTLQRLVVFAQV